MSTEIRAISHDRTNRKTLELVLPFVRPGARVLDVGAGEGYFSQLLGEHARRTLGIEPSSVVHACDLFPGMFRYDAVPCDPIDASGRFPYDDASFDVVASIEVVEHLENQFQFVRELHRVLKPGGRAYVSTPNLLNLNSRLRFLHSGSGLLFDPLPLASNDPVHTSGHIHPITFYYLAYMLHRAGFADVRVHYDRRKRSAAVLAFLLGPFISIGHAGFVRRLRRKSPAVFAENAHLVGEINSWDMQVSRSIIVEGTKR